MKSLKVLIVTGKLQPYRTPVFNKIAERGCDLTVAHSYKKLNDGSFLFKEIILEEKKIGPFTYHKTDLKKFCSQFDIVIATFYLQKISFMRLLFGSRDFKLAYWGIGVRASQKSRFDSPTFLNYFRYWVARKSDAMIFYTDYAREKYIKKRICPSKLFVMHNTVLVNPSLINLNQNKTSLLFIGTLNKSKKIFELLEAYRNVYKKESDIFPLEIIGGGSEFNNLLQWIEENDLSKKIIIHGPIYSDSKKAEILNRSICAFSPDQAGLSVLETMAYGIPFVTHRNAITGGEILNINNDRGILFEDFDELEDIILDVCVNPLKYKKLGCNSYVFYKNNRTIDHMVNGFVEAKKFLVGQ